ncbi:hypothetical protein, partial [Vibrio sagamiensis]
RGIGRLSKSSRSTYVKMGGNMRNTHLLNNEIFSFEDVYKGKSRLNILAHGEKVNGVGKLTAGSKLTSNGSRRMEADELHGVLSSQYNLSNYDNIRTIVCYSGDGGSQSFGAQLAKVTGKTVKSYSGPVYNSIDIEGNTAIFNKELTDGRYDIFRKYEFSDELTIAKVNPFSFYEKDYWTFAYNPVYFRQSMLI